MPLVLLKYWKMTQILGEAFDINEKNELTRVCYMTERTQNLINTFYDVIIIDGSRKSNRFNMHLLDVVIINNFGQTCTCFFSLFSNQTYESFYWHFHN